MDKLDKNIDHWLNDDDLFEIADSLLFEIRLDERLEFIYNTHVQVNGIRIFDAFIARLDIIKRIINRDLMEAIRGREGEEDNDGNIRYYTISELREDRGYPTSTLFPANYLKRPHVTWKDVDDITIFVKHFKLKKEITVANYKAEIINIIDVPSKGAYLESSKGERECANFLKSGFDLYINENYRDKLIPYLIKEYTGKKPKQFGYMLYALNTLGLIGAATMVNQTQLHEDLTITFGEVGTRQRLQQLINELSRASSNEETSIQRHIHSIKTYLQGVE